MPSVTLPVMISAQPGPASDRQVNNYIRRFTHAPCSDAPLPALAAFDYTRKVRLCARRGTTFRGHCKVSGQRRIFRVPVWVSAGYSQGLLYPKTIIAKVSVRVLQ